MNKKKKILFLVTQSEFGGAQRFIYTLIRGLTQIKPRQVGDTQIDADKEDFLYPDITYKIRGACFKIWKEFRGAFKEKIIERALAKELQSQGLIVDTQKQISVLYDNEKIGEYVPDMVVDDKIIVELKSKTFLTKEDEKQFWLYLKGSKYRLGLLINFGRKLEIKRKIYDTARDGFQRKSAYSEGQNQRISAIDYEVVVAAGPEGDDKNGLLYALENKGINTKHLRYLRRGVNPFFDFWLGLVEIYKLIKKERPDILFLCSSKAGAMGSLIGRLSRVPKIIYRIGGWTFNDPRSFLVKLYYKFIEIVSSRWKDYIINNAESDRKQAIKLGIRPRKRIITIYNGIGELEFFSKEKARKKLNLKDSDFIVGTIANDYPSKGLKYLEKAKYELRDTNYKFVIIGKGNRFIPDAYKYLKAFDVFVLPSIKEGFPWTILEALKAEIPIVATCVGAIPEIINKCVEPGNVKELVKAIKNPKKFNFHKKFSLEKMIKEIEKLL